MILRLATMADAALLLRWRNDPDAVAASESGNAVAPDEHEQFMNRWNNRAREEGLFVAEAFGQSVGTGRIERVDAGRCRISYLLASAHRGKGFGVQLVARLVWQARAWGYTSIDCRIKRGNRASVVCAMRGGVNGIQFV